MTTQMERSPETGEIDRPTTRRQARATGEIPLPGTTRRSVGRTIGLWAYGVVAGIVVIALIAAGTLVYTIQRSFPTLEGTLAVPGLGADVEVVRNAAGIPTVTAVDAHDLFVAQGYVHAQDRFWEMDFRRHVTAGRLSELFGASQLQTDMFLRTLGWRELAAQEFDRLEPAAQAYYEAYADGVNAYLAENDGADASFEYAVLGLQNGDYEIEPWTPIDSIAWLKAMAWDLRANVEIETERALVAQSYTPEQVAELYPGYPFDRNPVIVPDPTLIETSAQRASTGKSAASDVVTTGIRWTEVDTVIEAASALLGGAGEGIGSNSWVVSGDLTDTGMPLLANDPHLGAALPSVWHQMNLTCRTVSEACPFDVAGFGFAGVPGIIIGHNARIAWGFTNLTSDVTDLYIERVDGDQYWRDGELVPLELRTETIEVAGAEPVSLEVRSTVHGPIVSGLTASFDAIAADPETGADTGSLTAADDIDGVPPGEYAVSLKWTALEPGDTAASIFALNAAGDFEEFRAAAALFDVPAQNLVYADVDGNIGYQMPGVQPIRGAGDGSVPQPGWDSAYDWQGVIPFDELPTVFNPDEGYIVTANNAAVGPTYDYLLTNDWAHGWRAARIVNMIERRAAAGPLTASDMRDIQADNEFWMGMRLAAAYQDIEVEGSGAAEAIGMLRAWDAQSTAASPAAAYANVLWDELVRMLFVEREDPLPVSHQSRLFLVVDRLLADPESPWWQNDALEVSGRDAVLAAAAESAYGRLVDLQGANPSHWSWGGLHALTLRSDTFGSSGIAPLEALFNRGPYEVGGGSSVANATGWRLGDSFETVTVPSLRMIVDLGDLDASQWQNLTGNSGHVMHPNYIDQVEAWQRVELAPWAFSPRAVAEEATHTLTLTPAE